MNNTVKMDVIVRKDFPLHRGESLEEASTALSNAGRAFILQKLNLVEKTGGAYLVEAFSSSAIFSAYKRESNEDSKYKYYALAFKRLPTGDFEFTAMQEVEKVVSFQAKSTPTLKSMWNGVV
jgi:hypothetical protein